MESCDVLIIGAGPGGLAAAKGAKDNGAGRVIILERDTVAGGILNQCIHDGFGLVRYGQQLSGPEYASRAVQEAESAGAELWLDSQAIGMTNGRTVTAAGPAGLRRIQAGAVVLATGCRERTRGAISIPGTRPAGVFTAGVVQNLVNMRNIMIGKRVVILGSGDIGLIMARRLTLEGAQVQAVIEAMPSPGGLARNISQCLYDFGIPIYIQHTVSRIIGDQKLTGVEISKVDEHMQVISGTARHMDCDALVLSVGLIPENEVAQAAGVALDQKTNGVRTDSYLQTNVPGIFSCGNARSVMDLADFVSEQGIVAGHNAAAFLRGEAMKAWNDARGVTMLKGFPEKDSVTCTLCPSGCQVTWDEGAQAFRGNRCPRGEKFARQERQAPRRTLTTTMRVEGGVRPLVSVRSRQSVARENLKQLCAAAGKIHVQAPVEEGQVLCRIPEAEGQEIEIIATAAVPAQKASM